LADFVEIQLESGATFSTEITVSNSDGTAKNLDGYTARSQMRKSYYATTSTTFDVNISDSASGTITMGLTAANTANIKAGRYVYDVEIEDGQGSVTRIFEGIVTVSPNVTR
jgi:hypothetical protein